MSRFNADWLKDFETQREMQEDRLHVAASLTCNNKCTGDTLLTNMFLPHEQKCLDACLAKYTQANLIANINLQKFEAMQTGNAKK